MEKKMSQFMSTLVSKYDLILQGQNLKKLVH